MVFSGGVLYRSCIAYNEGQDILYIFYISFSFATNINLFPYVVFVSGSLYYFSIILLHTSAAAYFVKVGNCSLDFGVVFQLFWNNWYVFSFQTFSEVKDRWLDGILMLLFYFDLGQTHLQFFQAMFTAMHVPKRLFKVFIR